MDRNPRNFCTHYKKELNQIIDLFERTIETGESNSALLIGSRGTGKTTLVNNAVAVLRSRDIFNSNAVLVRLHGLVHTEDRSALKSITVQMDLENTLEGKVFGSFSENMSFLLACLRSGEKRTSKSVIFILDEFHLFCYHHNQTLLYNLFDVSQSAQTPVCVLGITCRLDVVELMEKRVKSRFSHRQIFLHPIRDNPSPLIKQVARADPDVMVKIDESLEMPQVLQLLDDVQLLTQDKQSLKNLLVTSILNLKTEKNLLKQLENQVTDMKSDDTIGILKDLCVAELCLLIAMKHHVEIYENQPMNFEMIYNRYQKLTNGSSQMKFIPRQITKKSFEHIMNMELVSPLSSGCHDEYQMFRLLVIPQQIFSALHNSVEISTDLQQWLNVPTSG